MAVRRYEISLTRREISYLEAAMKCSIYYINTNEKPGELYYAGKGAIYYATIATVIFSRVKISCLRAKASLVFHWCLYNKRCSSTGCCNCGTHSVIVFSFITVQRTVF